MKAAVFILLLLASASLRGVSASVQDVSEKLPLFFEANRGQTDPRARFIARGKGYSAFFTDSEAVFALTRTDSSTEAFRVKVHGAAKHSRPRAQGPLEGKSNYFIGNDPSRWLKGIPQYSRILYEQVYPGIDLVYYGQQRHLEFDFVVEPGADPGNIGLVFNGVKGLDLDEAGNLAVQLDEGRVAFQAPEVYQVVHGVRLRTQGSFVVAGNQVHFKIGHYDHEWPLVIDPVLAYSTYLGGTGSDTGTSIAVDNSGAAYVAGFTGSSVFPNSNAFDSTYGGVRDAFVSKFNAAGSALVYSTYIGGTSDDRANGIAVDSAGQAYVTGLTSSSGFPVTAGVTQTTKAGLQDGFVTVLNAAGSALVYSTYLGGTGDDTPKGIAVDASGNATVTGSTTGSFVTVSPVQASYGGGSHDAFLTKVNSSGTSLLYSTYLGGSGDDQAFGIAVDSSGSAVVAGSTVSANFPLTSAYQSSNNGGSTDAFVTRINAAGNAWVYSTYLGGTGGDEAFAVCLDSSGNAYLTGYTDFTAASPLFPATLFNFNPNSSGQQDAFLTKLSPTGGMAYSTYFGGQGNDIGLGIAVDSADQPYITGRTGSVDLPIASPIQSSLNGVQNVFVAVFLSTGNYLAYSTYLGGTSSDTGNAIALDPSGNAYVAGVTNSTDFPVSNALQSSYAGGANDAFVLNIPHFIPTAAYTCTATPSFTISPTFTVSPTISATVTISRTFSASPSFTHSPTRSQTVTSTLTPTETLTRTPTSTYSVTLTQTPTRSPSMTATATSTFSPTPTATVTISPTGTVTGTATPSLTSTGTGSATPSPTGSVTITATATRTLTGSPTATQSYTLTPTPSHSASVTGTFSFTLTGTISAMFTQTPTFTLSPTMTRTSTVSSTVSASPTPGQTWTASLTPAAGLPAQGQFQPSMGSGSPRVLSLLAVPNPLSGHGDYLGVKTEGDVEIFELRVYSAGYNLLSDRIYEQAAGPGWNYLPLDSPSWPNGILFLQLITRGHGGSSQSTTKIFLLKR